MQRRRKLYKTKDKLTCNLHSIPILFMLKNKYKSNVSYSIPSVCILVLLFGLIGFVNPSVSSLSLLLPSTSSAYATVETKGDSTASITLDTSNIVVDARYDEVSYASKDITISINNVESYALTITSTTSLTGGTVFTGADNKTPEEMEYNSWGYAYTNTEDINSTDDLATLTYHSFTGEAQTLESSSTNTTDSNNTSSSNSGNRILAFAAKFGNDAIPTTYHADIKLSLVSTPNQVVFDGITTMQEMTPEICSRAEVGDSTILKDDRSYPTIDGEKVSNTYRVTKLEDSRCWMTENLRITGDGSNSQITSTNSNGAPASGWILPSSSISGFSDDSASNAYLGTDNAGNTTGYYTWCAATAGTCSSTATAGASAPSSICPKGWRLPGGYGDEAYGNEFYNLLNNIRLNITLDISGPTDWSYSWANTQQPIVQGRKYNFAFTGYTDNDSRYYTTEYGYWWSGTSAYNNTNAYSLYIRNNVVYPGMYNAGRHLGYAVRCIAEENAKWSDGTDSGIQYMQDIKTGTNADSFCSSSLPNHASITLKDKRDGNSYTIVKTADGKCWMTENLRIIDKTISSADSDMASGEFIIPPSSISGFNRVDVSNAYYRYGGTGGTGYYSWCAATAGTCSSATTRGAAAPSSICPKNWKLPSGGSNTSTSDFGILTSSENTSNSPAGSIKIRDTPYNFTFTGYVYNNSLGNTDIAGYWWSNIGNINAAYVPTDAYSLLVDTNYVVPGDSIGWRYFGFAIRCIAR